MRLHASLQAASDEIAHLKAECVQHHIIMSGSCDVFSTPRTSCHVASGSQDVLSMPCTSHHIILGSPDLLSTPPRGCHTIVPSLSTSPHPQWCPFKDDQLPAYSDPVLDVPDIITKYNLCLNMDDIMNTMENVEGPNWKCVLEAFDIDKNVVDQLVDAMQRAKLN